MGITYCAAAYRNITVGVVAHTVLDPERCGGLPGVKFIRGTIVESLLERLWVKGGTQRQKRGCKRHSWHTQSWGLLQGSTKGRVRMCRLFRYIRGEIKGLLMRYKKG